MHSKSMFVTEASHAVHEIYYMLKHYDWRKTEVESLCPALVFMVNDAKGFYVGGMADRFKGIVSTYAWCKQRNIPFRIRHIFPFELADYLCPAQYDWRLKENEYTSSIWNAKLMRARGEYGRRLLKTKLKMKQLHFYGNRDFLQNINLAGKTNYTWGELFHELFQPNDELAESITRIKSNIGGPYISAVFRFQNLLGDFREYGYQILHDGDNREKLILKNLSGLVDLQKKNPGLPVLVTSDSSTFIKRASCIPGIHVIGGERVHIGCNSTAAYNTYLNSFIDFFVLADSLRIFSLGTSEMYPTQFPMYAAKVNDIPFERILLR